MEKERKTPSKVEVLNILQDGVYLRINNKEYYISHSDIRYIENCDISHLFSAEDTWQEENPEWIYPAFAIN